MKDCMARHDRRRSRNLSPEPSFSKLPQRLALAGIVIFAAIGIWAGDLAMERVERAHQIAARV